MVHKNVSQTEMEEAHVASKKTIEKIIKAANEHGISWPLDPKTTNDDVKELLFPSAKVGEDPKDPYVMPDYEYVHRKLAEKGVTAKWLWEKYSAETRASGGKPYMYTQFKHYYKVWATKNGAVMRLAHKPGDVMQVDWAGKKLLFYDPSLGRDIEAAFFIASLPYSGMIYTCACMDMTSKSWLQCHINAYKYFGGVTRLLIPDNLKTGVISHVKSEVILNRSYEELADFYNTAILPTRIKHPRDKGHAEGTVKIVTQSIIVKLKEMTFFSIDEVNKKVEELLFEVNSRPFSNRDGCRFSLYRAEEKEFMLDLPPTEFELAEWKDVKVPRDYLVSDGINKYSVPYKLIGETVQLRISTKSIDVYHNGRVVASHERTLTRCRDPIIKTSHMSPRHLAYLEKYTPEDLTEWAKSVGGCVEKMVTGFLSAGRVPEQGVPRCVSLRSLVESNSVEEVETAYRALTEAGQTLTIPNLKMYVKMNKSRKPTGTPQLDPPEAPVGFSRGSGYYN